MTPLSTLTPLKRAVPLPAGLLLEFSFGLHDFAVVVVPAVISYTINLILLVSLVFSNVKILLKFVDLNCKNTTFPLQRKDSNRAKKKKKPTPQTADLSYVEFSLILTPRPCGVPRYSHGLEQQRHTYLPGASQTLGFSLSTQQPE